MLKELASAIERKLKNPKSAERTAIRFVKEGEKPKRGERITTGILDVAKDWQLRVDINEKLVVPEDIVKTKQRPDIVIFSKTSKRIIFIELTVPWEEALEEAYERKKLRYTDLVEECKVNGWKAVCYPVEVGARGFVARSMGKLLKELGICGKERRTITRNLVKTTETSSNWLWLKSGEGEWKHKG